MIKRPVNAIKKGDRAHLNAPLNDFQRALHEAAAHLPDLSKLATIEQRVDAITAKVKGLLDLHAQVEQGLVPAIQAPIPTSPADALPFIQQKLRAALGIRTQKSDLFP